MELHELKSIWKEISEEHLPQKQVASSEIRKMLKGKTQNAVSKINRSIQLEGGLMIAMILAFSLNSLFGSLNLFEKSLSAVIMLMCLGFSALYWVKYRRINQVEIHTHNLKTSLQQLIGILDSFFTFYKSISYYLIPFSYLIGFLYGFSLASDGDMLETLMRWEVLLLSLLMSVLVIALYWPVCKWFSKKLYGNYLDELRDCLQELEEVPE